MVLEKILESPLDSKQIISVYLKGNQSYIFIRRTDNAGDEIPIFWQSDMKSIRKRPWCWERLKAGGEEGDRGWDGWMASPIQWTWVWANSGSWWWTGRPGMLQSMGFQRVRHNWATELTELHAAFGILIPWPDIKPISPEVQVQALNYWSTSEVPYFLLLNDKSETQKCEVTYPGYY